MSGDSRIEIPVEALKISTELYPPTVWRTYSFAPEWFVDAKAEAAATGHAASSPWQKPFDRSCDSAHVRSFV